MRERNCTNEVCTNISINTFTQAQPEVFKRINEDCIYVNDLPQRTVIFLVDGASSLSQITNAPENILNGHWAAITATNGVRKNLMAKTANLLILSANNEVAQNALRFGVNTKKLSASELPTSSGAVACIVNKIEGVIDIAQAGDATSIVVDKKGKARLIFKPKKCIEDAEAYKTSKTISETKQISISKALFDARVAKLLKKGRSRENTDDGNGYGAINGKPEITKYIMRKKLYTNEVSTLIFMTDGMQPPSHTFGKVESPQKIADGIKNLGLEKYYLSNYVLFDTDPELAKYPRFKKHDDASAIVLNF